VIANTLAGLLATDPALEDLFRLYGASSWARAVEAEIAGGDAADHHRPARRRGLAVIGTVVGEFLVGVFGAGEGLGVRIVSGKKDGPH